MQSQPPLADSPELPHETMNFKEATVEIWACLSCLITQHQLNDVDYKIEDWL